MSQAIKFTFHTSYQGKNVGAYFVFNLHTRQYKAYQHYARALAAYRKQGGYGHASIVPKADAVHYIGTIMGACV